MFFSSAFALALSISPVFSLPHRPTYVVHEKREALPHAWELVSPANSSTILLAKIGLSQGNLDAGHDHLMAVSDPRSTAYGQHWTPEKVAEFFQPSTETIKSVQTWLVRSGIDEKRVKLSNGKHWISFNATVKELEDLLQTKYNVYRHQSGRNYIGSESYHLPTSLQQHVDFVTPTIQFDAHAKITTHTSKQESVSKRDTNNCGSQITPECLRAMYGIPVGQYNDSKNSYGILEFAGNSYNQDDLNLFFKSYSSNVPSGTAPIYLPIDGGYMAPGKDSATLGESNLDLMYAMSLVYPQSVSLYETGDNDSHQATENNFLDAVDGSYCSYDGGDDSSIDAIYPHDSTNGYKGKPDCGKYKPANVISVSYGMNEASHPPAYFKRQCYEYMKLGLMGVTIMFASGDSGVAGFGGQCLSSDAKSGAFNPIFPGTCPYVTSVGGTQLSPNTPVDSKETAAGLSSGGFSNIFPIPDYQKDAVSNYYSKYAPSYDSSVYNNTKQVRGFPDVSANAVNYVFAVDGGMYAVSGTSAASPVFGAVVTLLNEARIRAGKNPIGFLNPVLYQHPEVLNDITSGNNPGCGTDGFEAVEGWDPVTGLGTPNYSKMEDLFLSLP
ncbi:peptidase S8/S53 domain-containing protein [Xylogone sp. PMI_703]|nr:peptidase S8/S53 domain-containing protein [Xylogone sp. PMI_703]